MSQWHALCNLADIPLLGARVVSHPEGDIALFRTADDLVFALRDKCPHKGGPLSQGLVHGHGETARVTCPLHGWNLALATGEACAPDVGCARKFPARISDGQVWIEL